jgi:hypothetical protein
LGAEEADLGFEEGGLGAVEVALVEAISAEGGVTFDAAFVGFDEFFVGGEKGIALAVFLGERDAGFGEFDVGACVSGGAAGFDELGVVFGEAFAEGDDLPEFGEDGRVRRGRGTLREEDGGEGEGGGEEEELGFHRAGCWVRFVVRRGWSGIVSSFQPSFQD